MIEPYASLAKEARAAPDYERATTLARRGYLRSEIVRETGLTADEVDEIKTKLNADAAQGRCTKTEDLFQ